MTARGCQRCFRARGIVLGSCFRHFEIVFGGLQILSRQNCLFVKSFRAIVGLLGQPDFGGG